MERFLYTGKQKFKIDEFNTSDTLSFSKEDKEKVLNLTRNNLQRMSKLQDKFYAENKESILIIFQAMDAGGKDGAIREVMHGINPQGVDVFSFKQPTNEELSHDYLWRCIKSLPQRGKIGIFNRSYYEEVLITKVHKLHLNQRLPDRILTKDIFEKRYEQINNFEKYLWENGTRVLKVFLNISKDEQKKRFLRRINDKSKNWKFSESDIKERKYWDKYQVAFEDMINNTSNKNAPWLVVPADKKWFARYIITETILNLLQEIDPKYLVLEKSKQDDLQHCKELLENEN